MKENARIEIEMRDPALLVPYARNARTHSDEQVELLATNIRQFGFTNPVLIRREGGIIAGHGRVLAASKLHLPLIPCIVLDLDDLQAQAYAILDNQVAIRAGWNVEILMEEIEDLAEKGFSYSDLGFTDEEMESMVGGDAVAPLEDEEEEAKPESDTTICPKCHHEFVL